MNRRVLLGFAAGMLFAFGLGYGRVTLPATIHGALDFFGRWEPQMFVFLSCGVAVYAVFRAVAARMERPLLTAAFRLPQPGWPSPRMLLGAALFGAAWGSSGICPGPAITSLFTSARVAVFVAAMVAGVFVYERVVGKRA
jgi:uncharacterized membrane protein YedE/YeeE